MLSGDNSILQRATDAKAQTEKASTKEQIQLQILGSFDSGASLNLTELKKNLQSIGVTVDGNVFPVTATFNGLSYTINSDGSITEKEPLTLAKILEYIDDGDVDFTFDKNQTFNKNSNALKFIGNVCCADPGGEIYYSRDYYRYSGDGNIYYVKYDNNDGTPVSLEQDNLDATITKDNNDNPILLTNSYGEYTRALSNSQGKFVYDNEFDYNCSILFPLEENFVLEFNLDGMAYHIYYID